MTTTPERPILRYHGGKFMMARWIVSHFQRHRIYVESFGGAANVLLRKARATHEIYNEKDGEIVNVFRMVRDRGPELRELLRLTPYSRGEFLESYEAAPADNPLEQARRTIVRSFMGFGSASACGAQTGFRNQSHGSGGSPGMDWVNYNHKLDGIIARLSGVIIECRPAIEVIQDNDTDETLHYVDPPYVMSTRKLRNPDCKKGYRFELSDDEHRELASVLNSCRGRVIISGYACALYDRELYPKWHRVQAGTHADGGKDATEVLWMNYDPPEKDLFG